MYCNFTTNDGIQGHSGGLGDPKVRILGALFNQKFQNQPLKNGGEITRNRCKYRKVQCAPFRPSVFQH